MTIDEALAQPGERVAAWDVTSYEDAWLGVYAVGEGGAKLLAHERMATGAREARTAALRARGVRVGATSGFGAHVWAGDADRFGVWSDRTRVATATRGALELAGAQVPVAELRAVVSFLDPRDLGHRGVRIERRAGAPIVLAEERDAAAQMDPGYNRDNVAIDGAWATFLGRDLAAFLGVPHEDQLP